MVNLLIRTGSLAFRLTLLGLLALLLTNCRRTTITTSPGQPQQGDPVWITVDNDERAQVQRVDITFGSVAGWSTTVPATFFINTCKDTEPYMTSLDIRVVTTYVDGSTGTVRRSLDLTCGLNSVEDADHTYSIYIAQGLDEDHEDDAIDMANAFMDEFDSYSRSHYYSAEPFLYTNQCRDYANAADLVISIGHGLPHVFDTGVGQVDLSETGYGNFRDCGGHGDAEYLVFAACQVLSFNDSDGHDWRYFWRNYSSTKSDMRPFSGLHMVMGFHSNMATEYRDGDHLFEEFAANLDSGDRVIDAWLEAVGDELDFDDGYNRGAVYYLEVYEDDTITSSKDDYIYGNSRYDFKVTYYE